MTQVRVLVVDDSAVLRELIVHLLSADPDIQVVGTASNGKEAVEVAKQKKPDVITMDFHMPTMNGLDATRRIMETHPVPIVIVSGSSLPGEAAEAFRLLEAGALAIVEKPVGMDHPDHNGAARKLLQTVKLMAEVKVVRRWPKQALASTSIPIRRGIKLEPMPTRIRLVALGASTGGPLVLRTILSGLPKSFPVPIVIVQHIAEGFTEGLATWLAQSSGIPVHVAKNDQDLLPGHAYVAPVGHQMMVNTNGRIVLSNGGQVNGHSPSVSCLFRSVAEVFGRDAIGVLLTGMGKDGAEELKLLKDRGAITFAQDQETSVVNGMPGEAVQLDAATHVLSPDEMVTALRSLAH